MTKDGFNRLLTNSVLELTELTDTKGAEYSNSEDQLANFKRQADELGLTSVQVLMVYLNKHLDAIKSYARTNKVLSEPIDSRILDALLYLLLLRGLIEDERNS